MLHRQGRGALDDAELSPKACVRPRKKHGVEAARLRVDWRSPRSPSSLEMAVTRVGAWRVGENSTGAGYDAAQVSFSLGGASHSIGIEMRR